MPVRTRYPLLNNPIVYPECEFAEDKHYLSLDVYCRHPKADRRFGSEFTYCSTQIEHGICPLLKKGDEECLENE